MRRTYGRARESFRLPMTIKKLPACLLGRLLVWVWGSTLAAFGRKGVPLLYEGDGNKNATKRIDVMCKRIALYVPNLKFHEEREHMYTRR